MHAAEHPRRSAQQVGFGLGQAALLAPSPIARIASANPAAAGRPGRPELWGLGYFALGDAAERGRADLTRYYGFLGGPGARVVAGLLTSPAEVRDFVRAYAESGCDQLVLFPTVPELDQVEQLAEALVGWEG